MAKLAADLPLQRGEEQPVVGVQGGGLHKGHGGAAGDHHFPVHGLHGPVVVQVQRDLQQLFLLAPVQSQDLVALQAADALREIVIQAVDAVLLRGSLGAELSLPGDLLLQALAQGGIVTDLLGNDVGGAGQGLFHRGDALLLVYIIHRRILRYGAVPALPEEQLGQGLQALLPGHGGPGAALWLIGTVQVLQLRQGLGGVDGFAQFLGELALLLNGGENRLPPLLQAPEILQPGLQGAQSGIVHGAMKFLAVAGDKGDGVPLVQKLDHVFDILRPGVQFPGQKRNDLFHSFSFA